VRTLCLVAVAWVVLQAGDGTRPQDLILGKWAGTDTAEGKEIKVTVEFAKDGAMKATIALAGKDIVMNGKYRFLDDRNIEVRLNVGDKELTEKNKIESISKEKLVLSDPEGKKIELKRIK
jgi:uncharacterized protein (TIGR03066 family)